MNRIFIILFVIILMATGCNETPKSNNDNKENRKHSEIKVPEVKPPDPIKEQIESMTLKEKIGQMVLIGIEGYLLDDKAKDMISNHHVGGVILFKKNIQDPYQLLNLINSIKNENKVNKTPLFISVDEEGGRVTRIPGTLKKLPTNKVIGTVGNGKASFEIGRVLARKIKSFGFNMNFAPVLDVNSNPQNPVIGDRSFSSNYEVVSKLGIQTMKGIQSERVISVIKHFPGHGDTSVDSHVGLPVVNKNIEELKELELIPFQEAINSNADMVMIAHILMPKIDSENPASMSKIMITNILRKELGFEGVAITDDMTMGAITKNYDISRAAIESILAGIDIVMIAHNHEMELGVIRAIEEAVNNGIVKEERIDSSVYRILSLKKKYGINNEAIESVDIEEINNELRNVIESFLE